MTTLPFTPEQRTLAVSRRDRTVYSWLIEFDGMAYVSIDRVAGQTHLTPMQVRYSLSRLERRGVISRAYDTAYTDRMVYLMHSTPRFVGVS